MLASDPRSMSPARTHVQKALDYAHDVVDGKIEACKFVRQACKRQLDDLERFKDHPLYYWDEESAGRVCRFIERLPHVKGEKAKITRTNDGLIDLEPWQCFILTTVFGWKRHDTGGRRFRIIYIEVPRGNAKSTLSSGVGLYMLTADGEEGAEVYSAATKRDQAKIVHGDALAMMRKRADFATKLGVTANNHGIYHGRSNSKFEPLSKDYNRLDGLNIHAAIIDELHAHKDRGLYDVLETGAGKRISSMIWNITTSGTDTTGVCYEQRTYVTKILNGSVQDENYFGIIYTIDDDDEWTDPNVWKKANPNWGISVMPDVFAQLALKAMNMLSAQNNFKTKHLDVWVNADQQWMPMDAWDRAGNPELRLEDFEGCECVSAIDLATRTDIVGKVIVFKRQEPSTEKCPVCGHLLGADGDPSSSCCEHHGAKEVHYYAFLSAYLPEAAAQDSRNSQYPGWVLEGRIKTNQGDVIDYEMIKADLLSDRDTFVVREVGFDPWQCAQLANEMGAEGLTMVEVRPTVQNFSEAMKEIEAHVRKGYFHHDANPVFRWMISNVVCHTDAKDNIFPRKERPENKIDGAVALIMAMSRALVIEAPYSGDRGFLTL